MAGRRRDLEARQPSGIRFARSKFLGLQMLRLHVVMLGLARRLSRSLGGFGRSGQGSMRS